MILIKKLPINNEECSLNNAIEFITRIWYDYDDVGTIRNVVYLPFHISKLRKLTYTNQPELIINLEDDIILPDNNKNMIFFNEYDNNRLFKKVTVLAEVSEYYYSYPAYDISKIDTLFNHGLHIGDVFFSGVKIQHLDLLELNGQTVNRSDYTDLWELNKKNNLFEYDEETLTLPKLEYGIKIGNNTKLADIQPEVPIHSHEFIYRHSHMWNSIHSHTINQTSGENITLEEGNLNIRVPSEGVITHSIPASETSELSQVVEVDKLGATGDLWYPHSFSYRPYIVARL